MRTLIRIGACISLAVASTAPAQAQLLDRLKKRAADAVQRKTEEKVNNKIDELSQKMVDNSYNALFGDSASGGGRGPSFAIGSNAKTEDRYTFDVVTTMVIESTKKGGASDGNAVMKLHFNTNQPYTGTSMSSTDSKKLDGTVFIIFDAKNQAMVMLMASEKSKSSITYDWKEALKYAQSAKTPKEQVNWDTVQAWKSYKKIGTKTIAGHAAEGYRAELPESTVEIWVTRDRGLAFGNMFGANSSIKQMRGRLPADYPQGMLLEMSSVNSKTGDKVNMRVTDISTNANVTYSMADYPKMDLAKK